MLQSQTKEFMICRRAYCYVLYSRENTYFHDFKSFFTKQSVTRQLFDLTLTSDPEV